MYSGIAIVLEGGGKTSVVNNPHMGGRTGSAENESIATQSKVETVVEEHRFPHDKNLNKAVNATAQVYYDGSDRANTQALKKEIADKYAKNQATAPTAEPVVKEQKSLAGQKTTSSVTKQVLTAALVHPIGQAIDQVTGGALSATAVQTGAGMAAAAVATTTMRPSSALITIAEGTNQGLMEAAKDLRANNSNKQIFNKIFGNGFKGQLGRDVVYGGLLFGGMEYLFDKTLKVLDRNDTTMSHEAHTIVASTAAAGVASGIASIASTPFQIASKVATLSEMSIKQLGQAIFKKDVMVKNIKFAFSRNIPAAAAYGALAGAYQVGALANPGSALKPAQGEETLSIIP